MKKLLLIIAFAIIVPIPATADNHEYWRVPQYKPLNQRNAEIQMQREYRMLQGMQRELRETGRIAPKTPADIYNLQEGYGYDGGTSNYYQPYGGYGY